MPRVKIKKQIIGTQMNADFQDSIKIKTFFGVYLRKWASLEAIKIFSNIFSGLKRLPRNPSQPPFSKGRRGFLREFNKS